MKHSVWPIVLLLGGCASVGHVATSSGRPQLVLHHTDWKHVSVAIASYNMAHGRELDRTNPSELVLYEAVESPEGRQEVRSKTVYSILPSGDSLIVASHRYLTDDLDDANADELTDQATYDIEQQELDEIGRSLNQNLNIAEPAHSQ